MTPISFTRLSFLLFPLIAIALTITVNVQLRFLIPFGALLLVFLICFFPMFEKFINHRIVPNLLFALSLLTFAAYLAAGILFQSNFSNFDHGDIACYASAFFNSTNGLPGVNALWGRPILAMHSEFLLIPVGWLFNLFPSPLTLIFIQAAALFAAWFILRRWLLRSIDRVPAEFLSLALALSPWIAVPLLKGFHGITLGLPFMALAAVSFIERKYKPFCVGVILMLFVKETTFLSVFALSMAALMEKRSLRWWSVPLVLSVAWAVLLKLVYLPLVTPSGHYFYSYLLPDSGVIIARLFSWHSLHYLLAVLLFGTALFYRSALAIVAIPILAINVVVGGQFASLQFHYIIEPVFWILCAAMAAIVKRNSAGEKLRLSVSALATVIILSALWRHGLPLYTDHPNRLSYQAALSNIPDCQRVALGAPLSGHLWKCGKLGWVLYESVNNADYDYFVVQKTDRPAWCTESEFARVTAFSTTLANDLLVFKVWEDPVMAVYRKTGFPP